MNSFLCTLIYIFLLAASTVYVGMLSRTVDVNILNFAVTVIAFAVFNALNLSRCKYAYKSIRHDPILWLVMSLFLAGSWMFSYFSTASSSADFSMAIVFLSMGGCASLHKKQRLKLTMCLLSMLLCYIFSLKAGWLSFLYAIFAGTSLYAYAFYSKRFAKRNQLSALDILSIRFFPLLLISAGLMIGLTPAKALSFTVNDHAWFFIVILALSNRVLPMLFFQPAVQGMATERLGFLLSFIPLVTYILQGLVNSFFPTGLFFSVLISTFSLNIDRFSFFSQTEADQTEAE